MLKDEKISFESKNDILYFHLELETKKKLKEIWKSIDNGFIKKINFILNKRGFTFEDVKHSYERSLTRCIYDIVEYRKLYKSKLTKANGKIITTNKSEIEKIYKCMLLVPTLLAKSNNEILDYFVNEWRAMYRENEEMKSKKPTISYSPRNKSNKAGRTPKIKSPAELHTKIKGIPNWEKMSTARLSIKLGFSKNRLGQILSENGWSLPNKE